MTQIHDDELNWERELLEHLRKQLKETDERRDELIAKDKAWRELKKKRGEDG